MKILNGEINGYKQLKNFKINMTSDSSDINLKFLIGENGTGKSSFLEALSIIFTKSMMNQDVGFEFNLEYRIEKNSNEYIYVKLSNLKKINGEYEFTCATKNKIDSEYKNIPEEFSELKKLHPSRIFTIGSGPHNNFEDVLIKNPSELLADEILEIKDTLSEKFVSLSNLYENTIFNPIALNFDSNSLVFILISLLNYPPEQSIDLNNEDIELDFFDEITKEREKKFFASINLLKENISKFSTKGFSIVINHNQIKRISEMIKQQNSKTENFSHKFFSSLEKILEMSNPNILINDEKHHYYFDNSNLTNYFFENPQQELTSLDTLTTFMVAYRIGILESGTIYLKNEYEESLITEKSFSDGEWSWLAKMALVILAQTGIENDFLFIYDEPDAFLNEGWIEEFVFNIDEFSRFNKESFFGKSVIKNNDYFIATHSTLMLTDALQNQVYKFTITNKNIQCDNINFSTFGADRGLISSKLFLNEKRSGRYVENIIEQVFKNNDKNSMDILLDNLGSGYNRFLIQELKIYTDRNFQ